MARKADNDNDLGFDKSQDGQGVIENASTGFEGRTDLFTLALATQKVMLEIKVQLKEFGARRQSAKSAEGKLIEREMRGLMSKHREAGERLLAIQQAMPPEMRVNLWRLIDLGDSWK